MSQARTTHPRRAVQLGVAEETIERHARIPPTAIRTRRGRSSKLMRRSSSDRMTD